MTSIENKKKNNKQWFGLLLILVGILFLGNTLDLPMPEWVFSWPMLLIGIGIFSGIANKFKDWSWLIMVGIGFIFIIDDITGRDIKAFSLIIPFVMIYYGLKFMLKKDKKIHVYNEESGEVSEADADNEDVLSLTAVFAGNKKIIVNKNLKGGEIISVFGGNDVNLINADFNGTIKIEIISIFAGTKLIVPSNWIIKSEMVSVFGGLDDKRSQTIGNANGDKVLIIEGTNIFGGIDIRSY